MKAAISPWHDTLSQALDAGMVELKERATISPEQEQQMRETFAFGGLRYGETKQAHGELESYKGKPTKKFAHLTIYRAESGRYEITTYVL
jgi:hypothetical protein